MGCRIPAEVQQVESKQDAIRAAQTFEKHGDHGALIRHFLGRILSCETPMERIFGVSQIQLIGELVWEFLPGQRYRYSSTSCVIGYPDCLRAREVAHLRG